MPQREFPGRSARRLDLGQPLARRLMTAAELERAVNE
jgi:hypothetical protein